MRGTAVIRRAAIVFAILLGSAAAATGSYFGYLQYEGNIHVVDQGKFYRSAQLDQAEFAAVIHKYGIKAILNLRGKNPHAPWYRNEIAVSKRLGVAHYDYGISARRRVTARQIEALLQIIRDAPKPMLVHCQAGADRAGLVSALYALVIEHENAADADRQLSLVYGHFPYLMSRSKAMDESFWAFVKERPARTARIDSRDR